MKKTFLILTIFTALMVIFLTGVGPGASVRAQIGKKAPSLSLENADRRIVLDEMKGRYVLLSFWDSADAASRAEVNMYTDWMASHPAADIDMVAVNFDTAEGLFRELVRRDGLDPRAQYNVQGLQANEIRRAYALDNGNYGSLLLDPEGKIIAQNPSEATLNRYFRSPLALR